MTDGARKAIFITGGGSGIGRATARFFAAKGWLVGIADIDEAGMRETAAALPTGLASIHRLDVRERDQWDRALGEFLRVSGGRLDCLFNNAGIGSGGKWDTLDPAEADRVIDINFRGIVNGIYAALPHLRATPGSAIVNTGSASGYYGSPGLAVYSATKFAVRALTEALDIEFAPDGITVRDIMPGFIDTPLLNRAIPGSNETSRDRVVAAGLEFTPVEQVAQAVWDAIHGDKVHIAVGKTARRLAFAMRWTPGRLRKQMRARTGDKGLLGNQ
jgi:NAD(P)-dependent dehydrogenase (short-subunit alcohol dehydrogenase family)